jgi:hypothetical protein
MDRMVRGRLILRQAHDVARKHFDGQPSERISRDPECGSRDVRPERRLADCVTTTVTEPGSSDVRPAGRRAAPSGSARPSADEIDALLLTWVRGEEVVLPPLSEAGCADVLLRIDFHGVAGLIAPRIGDLGSVPATLRAGIVERVVAAEVWEAEHLRILRRVLSALGDAGIKPLLLKGTGVAYRCYEPPALRLRGDTDVLVPRERFESALDVLVSIGGVAQQMPAGPVEGCARHVVFESTNGSVHEFDIHFGLSGHPALRQIMEYEDLAYRAVALPSIASDAWTCSDVDALLITAMHRLKHRQAAYYVQGIRFLSSDRLIWFADLDRLCAMLTEEDWRVLCNRALENGLVGALLSGLEAINGLLSTSMPHGILVRLGSEDPGCASRFLEASVLGQFARDFRALPRVGDRIEFVRKIAFPPSDHMHQTFAHVRPRWLPWLYFYRAGRGSRVLWRGNWGGER